MVVGPVIFRVTGWLMDDTTSSATMWVCRVNSSWVLKLPELPSGVETNVNWVGWKLGDRSHAAQLQGRRLLCGSVWRWQQGFSIQVDDE